MAFEFLGGASVEEGREGEEDEEGYKGEGELEWKIGV